MRQIPGHPINGSPKSTTKSTKAQHLVFSKGAKTPNPSHKRAVMLVITIIIKETFSKSKKRRDLIDESLVLFGLLSDFHRLLR